jgi:hypothetical protein
MTLRGPSSHTVTMEPSLKIADLHEAYRSATPAEAIAMANLGAICWPAARGELFSQWETAMSAEETAKADTWRKEGAAAMLESVKTRLAQADTLTVRLATAEETVTQLLADAEAEAAKRAEALVAAARQDFTAAKAIEMADIKARLAAAEAKEEMLSLLREAHQSMRDRIAVLQGEVTKYQEAVATKSSHAIGKAGELTIQEIIESRVVPWFASATVENMVGVGHAADFHLTVSSPHGKQVKMLIDVKKYKDPVRLKEVQKLHADIDGDMTAVGGILISLDSAIMGKAHFQVEKTPHRKSCINLVLKDYGDAVRGDIILWAARVISTLHPDGRIVEEDRLYEEVVLFVGEINSSVREAETAVKACMKALEGSKAVRDGLVRRVTAFRMRALEDLEEAAADDVIEHVAEAPKAAGLPDAVRCTKIKGDGERCRNRRSGGEFCKSHQK